MKTAQEILAQYGYSNMDYDTKRALTSAMNEYAEDFAKQKAEAFGEWVGANGYKRVGSYWYKNTNQPLKTSDLFELFNKQP